jgi:minor extracellular serine protease Vpr
MRAVAGVRRPSTRVNRFVTRVLLPLTTAAVVTAAATPGLAPAEPDPGHDPAPGSMLAGVKPLSLQGVDRSFVPALADQDRSVSVVVEMQGEPVAVAQAAALEAGSELTAGVRAQTRDALKAAQDAIVPDINQLGGKVRSQLQDAYNGIRVRIPAGKARELAKLPGGVAVRAISLAKADNTSSVPFIGTPAVWQDLGLTGAGIRIGIIDSGSTTTTPTSAAPATRRPGQRAGHRGVRRERLPYLGDRPGRATAPRAWLPTWGRSAGTGGRAARLPTPSR